ncbi:SDR family NAD(P)-dependent oxidoreductase [Fischerella sp. JS2]|uniref:polyketide synthase family protein n=1 Tax=Fischerella sp. JS2 TaxID=2597771 RepID=UPI0028ECEC3D|nr:SDR family NAD(P)-dependent oxidoreductase [Fischerella sp. JS2]
MTGCTQVHPQLAQETSIRVLDRGELWPTNSQLRAGVSAMGFGGINTHVVLEGISTRRQVLSSQEHRLLSSAQDAELMLVAAEDANHLLLQVEHLLTLAPKLSRSELTDLAAQLEKNLTDRTVRAAIITSTPQELTTQLEILRSWLQEEFTVRLDSRMGVFLGVTIDKPQIGFLFPGQASPTYFNGGAWERRFECVHDLYQWANLPQNSDRKATAVAQPAIVTAAMAGLRVLNKFGIAASVSVGHSLGELSALHWAGAFDEAELLRIATVRGQTMTKVGNTLGAMASIQASQPVVENLINGDRVVIAGLNSPQQTVISGEVTGVTTVVNRAQAMGLKAVTLPVSHAFHSPLVADAAQPFADYLGQEAFQTLQRTVVSTVTGRAIDYTEDLRSLLHRQITATVRFIEAVTKAAAGVNLFIEVGPGRVLSGLVTEFVDVPIVSLDASGSSLKGLLQAVGAAFVVGTPVKHKELFSDRFTRPFDLNWQPQFFVNPCELAPRLQEAEGRRGKSQGDSTPPDLESLNSRSVEFLHSCSSWSQPRTEGRRNTALCPLPSTFVDRSPLELVCQLVAQRAELPVSAIADHHRLLSDLHLNSITVSQIVVEAARSLNIAPPIAPISYADATVAEVAQALEELLRLGSSQADSVAERLPSGVDAWVRTFTIELVERSLPRRQVANLPGSWKVITTLDHPLAEPLQQAFQDCEGSGVVVCLPAVELGTASLQELPHIELLLEAYSAVLAQENARFVLVQQSGGGAGFARTLYLEAPQVTTCVVNVPMDRSQAAEWVLAEARAAIGYSEAHYDELGIRYEPVLKVLPQLETSAVPLKADDVLLVTGGGKGITAECAFALAKETGVRLVLLGRSQPERDPELLTNLDRMTAAGIEFRYIATDITDAVAVKSAIHTAEAAFGSISAILHGAARNVPQLLSNLEQQDFLHTLAPKVQGLQNVLAAVNPEDLRLLIGFGSIIARTGLPGEADYALANEWLVHLIQRWQADHPHCRCLAIEWSIWSEVGMGSRLGSIDTLLRQGITPIPTDQGIAMLRHLLTQPFAGCAIATGRFGGLPTIQLEQTELQLLRFLEQPRVYYPGVELVVDATLSTGTDLYLNDHQFQGERVFPAVLGLEAMAQVAMALASTEELPVFEQVKFERPVVVAESTPLKIQIAALMYESGHIEVTLRSEQTGFAVNHFRATCWIGTQGSEIGQLSTHALNLASVADFVSLNPQRDLYGEILFHQGRFRRLSSYRQLRAKECLAEITPDPGSNWFSSYLPAQLILGDPAVRDAAVHALQACIPQATILPIAVERLELSSLPSTEPQFVYAKERSHDGNTFIYDLEICDRSGQILERWQGLQLKVIQSSLAKNPWVESLLGPYLERRIQERFPSADIAIIVDCNPNIERRVHSDRVIQQAIGSKVPIWRRFDGKPEVVGCQQVSVSHTEALTIAIVGKGAIGCDVEPVVSRPVSIWQDLLGIERFKLAEIIHQETGEDQNTAATRIWTAIECLKKAGAIENAPLILASLTASNDEVLLQSGDLSISTFDISVQSFAHKLVFSVLLNKRYF